MPDREGLWSRARVGLPLDAGDVPKLVAVGSDDDGVDVVAGSGGAGADVEARPLLDGGEDVVENDGLHGGLADERIVDSHLNAGFEKGTNQLDGWRPTNVVCIGFEREAEDCEFRGTKLSYHTEDAVSETGLLIVVEIDDSLPELRNNRETGLFG